MPGILDARRTGRLYSITIEGHWAQIEAALNELGLIGLQRVNLSLEDAFISLMRKNGYKFTLPDNLGADFEYHEEVAQ